MTRIYKCWDCGTEFKEPAEVTTEEYAAMMRATPYEYAAVECCPRCRSTDIDEFDACISCGDHVQRSDRELCESCAERFDRFMDHVTDAAQKDFDIAYKDVCALIEEWANRHW